jgi:hypothetical protein
MAKASWSASALFEQRLSHLALPLVVRFAGECASRTADRYSLAAVPNQSEFHGFVRDAAQLALAYRGPTGSEDQLLERSIGLAHLADAAAVAARPPSTTPESAWRAVSELANPDRPRGSSPHTPAFAASAAAAAARAVKAALRGDQFAVVYAACCAEEASRAAAENSRAALETAQAVLGVLESETEPGTAPDTGRM